MGEGREEYALHRLYMYVRWRPKQYVFESDRFRPLYCEREHIWTVFGLKQGIDLNDFCSEIENKFEQ